MATSTLTRQQAADELVIVALARLDEALRQVDLPMTAARRHAIRNHITVAKVVLLTQPLRPKEMPGA